MEAIVHARGQAQGDVVAVAIGLDQGRIDQQILAPVGRALGLEQFGPANRVAGAYDPVARADQYRRIGVERLRTGAQLARESVAPVPGRRPLRLGETEIEAWRKHFNEVRPHSSLGFDTGQVRREASTYQRSSRLRNGPAGCAMRGLRAPARCNTVLEGTIERPGDAGSSNLTMVRRIALGQANPASGRVYTQEAVRPQEALRVLRR